MMAPRTVNRAGAEEVVAVSTTGYQRTTFLRVIRLSVLTTMLRKRIYDVEEDNVWAPDAQNVRAQSLWLSSFYPGKQLPTPSLPVINYLNEIGKSFFYLLPAT